MPQWPRSARLEGSARNGGGFLTGASAGGGRIAGDMGGGKGWTMPTWSDNMEAVARAVCAKRLAHDDNGEERPAVDVDMW